jgi:hypothetical protein
LHINSSCVLNVHYPDRHLVALLIHNDMKLLSSLLIYSLRISISISWGQLNIIVSYLVFICPTFILVALKRRVVVCLLSRFQGASGYWAFKCWILSQMKQTFLLRGRTSQFTLVWL